MKPLSSIHPAVYRASVSVRRLRRSMQWRFGGVEYALSRSPCKLPFVVVTHNSLLLRKLEGSDMNLQLNKVISLRSACSILDSILIAPGEVFSFWRLVGKPSAGRGFPPGLQLSFGELVSMEGGGLCQLSNLLHWMVLQSPLTVIERHRHSTDPFPDHRRTVPFGTGATVFYNYIDFAFRNDTLQTFEILVSVGGEYLRGELRCEGRLQVEYSVVERNHRFTGSGGSVYRENELWRIEREASSGRTLKEEILMKNRCRVMYDVPREEVEE